MSNLSNIDIYKLNIEELLNHYNDCNTFVLCQEYGLFNVSLEDANKYLDEYYESGKSFLFSYYEMWKEKDGIDISFEKLFDCIKKEYLTKEKSLNQYYNKGHFIADHIYEFFSNCDHVKEYLNSLEKEEKVFKASKVFEMNRSNKSLEKYLLNYKISFITHASSWFELKVVYEFVLNEFTKSWLISNMKNRFNMDGYFSDLAFYNDGKLRYSMLSHEFVEYDIND